MAKSREQAFPRASGGILGCLWPRFLVGPPALDSSSLPLFPPYGDVCESRLEDWVL